MFYYKIGMIKKTLPRIDLHKIFFKFVRNILIRMSLRSSASVRCLATTGASHSFQGQILWRSESQRAIFLYEYRLDIMGFLVVVFQVKLVNVRFAHFYSV